jgi:hypothetical protein
MIGEYCENCGAEVEMTDTGAWCPDCLMFVSVISDEDLVDDTAFEDFFE